MACATLKRTLDWDNNTFCPNKKRRCVPVSDSPTSNKYSNVSPFAETLVPQLSPEKMAANIREQIRRLHRRKQLNYVFPEDHHHGGHYSNNQFNQFDFASSFSRHRQPDSMNDSSSDSSGADSPTPTRQTQSSRAERALFTFSQVNIICERMIRERENELREQYDKVLQEKLAEQYDAFVKFTYDQLHRRQEAAPSYLS